MPWPALVEVSTEETDARVELELLSLVGIDVGPLETDSDAPPLTVPEGLSEDFVAAAVFFVSYTFLANDGYCLEAKLLGYCGMGLD